MPTLDVLRQWRQSLVLPDSVLVPLPCLPLFCFFLAGSLPLSLRHFDQIELPMSILLLAALPALGFLFLPRPYWKWILAAVPALLITLLHVTAPWRSYEDQLFTEESFAHIKGVVVDDRLPIDDSLKWLEPPRSVEVRLTHLRFSSG